jgi:hypothetical protein
VTSLPHIGAARIDQCRSSGWRAQREHASEVDLAGLGWGRRIECSLFLRRLGLGEFVGIRITAASHRQGDRRQQNRQQRPPRGAPASSTWHSWTQRVILHGYIYPPVTGFVHLSATNLRAARIIYTY